MRDMLKVICSQVAQSHWIGLVRVKPGTQDEQVGRELQTALRHLIEQGPSDRVGGHLGTQWNIQDPGMRRCVTASPGVYSTLRVQIVKLVVGIVFHRMAVYLGPTGMQTNVQEERVVGTAENILCSITMVYVEIYDTNSCKA